MHLLNSCLRPFELCFHHAFFLCRYLKTMRVKKRLINISYCVSAFIRNTTQFIIRHNVLENLVSFAHKYNFFIGYFLLGTFFLWLSFKNTTEFP